MMKKKERTDSVNPDDFKPLIQGWMKKKSPSRFFSRWQKRYFVLYKLALLYYNDTTSEKPDGILPIREIVSVQHDDEHNNRLDVIAGPKTFHLEASTMNQANAWVEALQQLISNCKRRPSFFQPSRDQSVKFWKNTWRNTQEALLEVAYREEGKNEKNRAFTKIDKTNLHLGEEKDEYTLEPMDKPLFLQPRKPRSLQRSLSCSDLSLDKNKEKKSEKNTEKKEKKTISSNINKKPKTIIMPTVNEENSDSEEEEDKLQETKKSEIPFQVVVTPPISKLRRRTSLQKYNEQDQIFYRALNIGQPLAQPLSFGSISMATHKDLSQNFFLLSINNDDCYHDLSLQCINRLKQLHHSYFMQTIQQGKTENDTWSAYRLPHNAVPLFELFDTKNKVGLTPALLKKVAGEILEFIVYIHQKKIIWVNMSPEVIYYDNNHICVYDFFLCCSNEELIEFGLDLPCEYHSPEFENETKSSDWWRFGVLLYELTVGIPPFRSNNPEKIINDIKNASFRFPNKDIDENLKDLIKKLLVVDINNRLGHHSWQDVALHTFFSGFSWNNIRPISNKVDSTNQKKINGKQNVINSVPDETTDNTTTQVTKSTPKSVRFNEQNSIKNTEYENIPDVKISTEIKSLKEGWLTKKGKIVKNWKDRYFILYPSYLLYFENDHTCANFKSKISLHAGLAAAVKALSKLILGSISIRQIIRVCESEFDKSNIHNFCISLHTTERVFYFATSNHNEYLEWYTALQKTIIAFQIQSPRIKPILKTNSTIENSNQSIVKKFKRSFSFQGIFGSEKNNVSSDQTNSIESKNISKKCIIEDQSYDDITSSETKKTSPRIRSPPPQIKDHEEITNTDDKYIEIIENSKNNQPDTLTESPVPPSYHKEIDNPFFQSNRENFPNFNEAMADCSHSPSIINDDNILSTTIDTKAIVHPCDFSNIEQSFNVDSNNEIDTYFKGNNSAKTPLTIQKSRLQNNQLQSSQQKPFTSMSSTQSGIFSTSQQSPTMNDLYQKWQKSSNELTSTCVQTHLSIPFDFIDSDDQFYNIKNSNPKNSISFTKYNDHEIYDDTIFSPITPSNNNTPTVRLIPDIATPFTTPHQVKSVRNQGDNIKSPQPLYFEKDENENIHQQSILHKEIKTDNYEIESFSRNKSPNLSSHLISDYKQSFKEKASSPITFSPPPYLCPNCKKTSLNFSNNHSSPHQLSISSNHSSNFSSIHYTELSQEYFETKHSRKLINFLKEQRLNNSIMQHSKISSTKYSLPFRHSINSPLFMPS